MKEQQLSFETFRQQIRALGGIWNEKDIIFEQRAGCYEATCKAGYPRIRQEITVTYHLTNCLWTWFVAGLQQYTSYEELKHTLQNMATEENEAFSFFVLMSADDQEIAHRAFFRYDDAYDTMAKEYDHCYEECRIKESEEFDDLSSISEDHAIIEDHGKNTYVWKISKISSIK